MAGGIKLGDLPSWILVLLIGFGVVYVASNGVLSQYRDIGELMIFGGLLLGASYFLIDLSNKL
jgi:hypothetical protein